jgi:hypothetical protein
LTESDEMFTSRRVDTCVRRSTDRILAMRMPAFSHGTTSFLWALGLAVYIWLGGMAVGMSRATAVVLAAVAGCAIFLYVRLYGEDDPRRPW